MLLSKGLGVSYILCGLLQYIQVLQSLVYCLELNRFSKNKNFFLKLPEPTPLTPRKQISFNTFKNNNNSFTKKPKRTRKADLESQHKLRTPLKQVNPETIPKEQKGGMSFEPVKEDHLFITPLPFLSLLLLLFLAAKIYENYSVSPEERVERLQKISLYSGFCLCLVGEFIERKGFLPSRATAASLSFALLNELVLLWSHSYEEVGESARVFQFLFISLVLLLGLTFSFVFKPSISLRIAISFVSCVHGGILLIPKIKSDEEKAANILFLHFELSQLLFLFFIIFIGLYSVAFKIAKEEIKVINLKFQKLSNPQPQTQ